MVYVSNVHRLSFPAQKLTTDHVLDLSRRELTNRVGNSNVGTAARSLLGGSYFKNTVDVDFEDDLENGLTSPHRRNRSQSEFTERGVILAVNTLTLVDRELNRLLVVGNSGECSLLQARNSLATGDDRREDVTLHGNTKR